jgi:hypothetical protein
MNYLIWSIVTLVLMAESFGIGYYVRGRGIAGVKIDIDNTKNELSKAKALVTKKTNA